MSRYISTFDRERIPKDFKPQDTEALMEFDPVKIYKYAISCYKKHFKVVMEEEPVNKQNTPPQVVFSFY